MEHAANGMATYIKTHFPQGSSLLIVTGMGNNGADGMVLARQLYGYYNIRLYLAHEPKSEMAKLQLLRAKKLGITPTHTLEDADVIVDAIFGAGLTRMLDENTTQIITKLNTFQGHKIACDIPTGMSHHGFLPSFCADVTLTMGAPKTLLFFDIYKDSVGTIEVVSLGIDTTLYAPTSNMKVLEESDFTPPYRSKQLAHKGTFGHASIFTGEKCGAGIITGLASSRFGAGLTTLVIQEKGVQFPPHLMSSNQLPQNTTAIAIGMGLGNHFDDAFLNQHVIESTTPIILDADAFYDTKLLHILEDKTRTTVITPHPKEFSHLWETLTGEALGIEEIQNRRFELVKAFSKKYPLVTLLLKGANMLIVHQGSLYVNPLGDARLSKGGSGDVLAGLIVALLAQGYSGIEAAIQGSLALTLASQHYTGANFSMVSTDIIEQVAHL
jgi:hydroxyethylthiazole kinase-like uncharacterized protein yjeF